MDGRAKLSMAAFARRFIAAGKGFSFWTTIDVFQIPIAKR
jgi:hypothetical protein